MLDSIIDGLKDQVGGELTSKLGLSTSDVGKVITSAKSAVEKTVGDEASGANGLSGILNLFSNNDNDDKGNSLMEGLGGNLLSSLTSNGFSSSSASSIQSAILPMVIGAITNFVKGDSSNLTNLVSSSAVSSVISNLTKGKSGGFLKGLFK